MNIAVEYILSPVSARESTGIRRTRCRITWQTGCSTEMVLKAVTQFKIGYSQSTLSLQCWRFLMFLCKAHWRRSRRYRAYSGFLTKGQNAYNEFRPGLLCNRPTPACAYRTVKLSEGSQQYRPLHSLSCVLTQQSESLAHIGIFSGRGRG